MLKDQSRIVEEGKSLRQSDAARRLATTDAFASSRVDREVRHQGGRREVETASGG